MVMSKKTIQWIVIIILLFAFVLAMDLLVNH